MTPRIDRPDAGLYVPKGRLLVITLLAGCVLARLWNVSSPEPAPDRSVRASNIRASHPGVPAEVVERYLDASDKVSDDLVEAGVENVGQHIHRRLRTIPITEDQRRAWYDAHENVFGGRSYEESWATVDRLARLDVLRTELGLEGTPHPSTAPRP